MWWIIGIIVIMAIIGNVIHTKECEQDDKCPFCNGSGTGSEIYESCWHCNGDGKWH